MPKKISRKKPFWQFPCTNFVKNFFTDFCFNKKPLKKFFFKEICT